MLRVAELLQILINTWSLFIRRLRDKNYNKNMVDLIIAVDMALIFMGIYLKIQIVGWAVLFNICVLFMFIFQKIIELLKLKCRKER